MTGTPTLTGDGPVVVVGGGVVGLCTAYYLATAGLPVEVVERRALGSGASRGNAGWVCLSHSTPVPSPGVLRYALRSVGRPDSPLYLRPLPDPAFLRWLWRFWRSSAPAAFRRGYAAIADLNHDTFDLFDGLREAGVATTLTRPGMVHAFLSEAEARHHLAIQREMAEGHYPMPDDITTGDEARLLDGALSSKVRAAYLVEGEGVVDPEGFARGLGEALAAAGVKVHENAEVTGFRSAAGRVTALRTDRGEIPCSAVVVAAGMRSPALLRELGHRLPLQAGKGYSFAVDLDPAPRHTLYFGERRAVASPIGTTTRIGGTMELSGNNNRLDWRRIVAVALASRHYLGRWFDDPDDLVSLIRDPWVGGRPFLPDGLPVIDRLPGRENVFAATGHGMLGVTLGPATGHRLAEYIRTGHRPEVLAPFGFDRLRG
ncbi:glycine/D-amino acid oxidase-like deaminating enzyme [Streptomyces sp. SAI-144]|uniref:NAD(P)/FAD-dependent oxidoreductase n=1 Tax=unclassified Streptomyces TaxID=2593676 RepID=UPI002473AE77|nr:MULTISPECIES: FAD-dependent oxidoreductase [unclassified Streptomyces]MDH6433826.1 glycine/D-amino acid oxidase-like deaminating enzyme [Streptomyces sp. SAI-144]MDH6490808.1 glycine/D-amino acid oxidase-like deaminating enzyme [Streptomyces sp. SAI-127]